MTNEFSGLIYRSIIKKYIGFLFQLLTKLFKAFDNHSSINTTFNYVWKERLMTGQKPSYIQTMIMHRSRYLDDRTSWLPSIWDTHR